MTGQCMPLPSLLVGQLLVNVWPIVKLNVMANV